MINDPTKADLQKKINQLELRVQKLQRSLGLVRKDITNIVFPHEHRETMDRVVEVVDRAINRT
jgi:type II secretory pathway component PulJ